MDWTYNDSGQGLELFANGESFGKQQFALQFGPEETLLTLGAAEDAMALAPEMRSSTGLSARLTSWRFTDALFLPIRSKRWLAEPGPNECNENNDEVPMTIRSMFGRNVLRASLLAFTFLAWLGPAQAAPAHSVDPRESKARAACAAGNVDKGISILENIYEETGDNNALYNQGRCFQLNGRNKEALDRFKEYRRRVPVLPADEEAQVEGYMRELRADLAGSGNPAPAPPVETVVAAPPPEPPAPPAETHNGLRVASAILVGAGAAAFVSGVYFSLRVRAIQNDLESGGTITGAEWNSKVQDGQNAQTYQWVSYGVAAAALSGSVVMYLVGRPSPGENHRVSISAAIGRDGGGGVLRFAF
jgi:hypothetical protein